MQTPAFFPARITAAPVAIAAVLATAGLGAQSVVSPAARAQFEGDSSSSYPLGRADGRFQQIHADLGASPRTISQHAYRRDAINQRGDVLAFSTELEVTMSVAAVAPDSAARDFASNHGAGAVTVLPRARVNFPTTSRPAQDPAPGFEHAIPFTTPFNFPGGAPICIDVVIYGNTTSRGNDVNFSAELDAQSFAANGSMSQPGYAYGSGCAAPGSSRPHDASFEFLRAADASLSLDIDSQDGMPTTSSASAFSALVVSSREQPWVWPWNQACTLVPAIDASVTLSGPNDAAGDWSGSINLPQLPVGQRFVVQIASSVPAAGNAELTFSNPSIITVSAMAPPSLPAVRIAHGSDHAATQGTVSPTVTVTEFR